MILRLLLILFTAIVPAAAVDIHGTLLAEYEEREGGTGLIANTEHATLGIAQVDLRFTQEFSDVNRLMARFSSSGGNLNVTEAWMNFGGFPYDGSMTIGRFFKPLGAPLQHSGLSYPALLFHTSAVQGLKFNAEYYPWRGEIGVANNNPFSAQGSRIGGSRAFGHPLPSTALPQNTHELEVYFFGGWQDGGAWGSLDVNFTGTYGSFSRADANVLNGLNIIQGADKSDRKGIDFSADYIYGPARFNGEYATFDEGKLTLTAWNISTSYRTGPFNWIIGYDRLDNNAEQRPLNVPASWERRRVSYAATYEYNAALQLRLQLEQNKEYITGTDNFHQGIPNDGVTFQVKYVF